MTTQLSNRDKLYLLIKNLKTRKKMKKLDYIKARTFFIKVKKKTINYKLALLKNIKL